MKRASKPAGTKPRATAARTRATAAHDKAKGTPASTLHAARKAADNASAKVVARAASAARSKAESTLKGRGERMGASQDAPSTTRLLHELQVEQVELEMRNDELQAAGDELAALHERYYDLYDFAPVAYFTVAGDRTLVEVNLAAARMLDRDRYGLPGRRLDDFVHPDSLGAYDRLLLRAQEHDEQVEDALLVLPATGEPAYVKAQARRFGTSDARVTRVVMMDLSALRTANEELARSLETFFRYWRP